MTARDASTCFVTGFPGFIGRRLVAALAAAKRDARILMLVQASAAEEARQVVRTLPRPNRCEILTGDIVDMHLGLSGSEYARLCDEVTDIFHLAALHHRGTPKDLVRRVNVEGTRNLLELARDCRPLRRFSHFSSALVSGTHEGVFMEDELEVGQAFHNRYEETKFQAERLVRRAARDLPVTIFRPSIVVGDSRSGEIDRFEGPYYLGILLVTSPLALPMPLPGGGRAPLNVVPVDFVARAAVSIAADDRSVGKTFHLVDPNPLSARRVYELVAERVRRRLPRPSVPSRLGKVLLEMPLVRRLTRPQRAALSQIDHLVLYNALNTAELLESTNLRCPPLASYLPTLVDFVQDYYRLRHEQAPGMDDPLDRNENAAAR